MSNNSVLHLEPFSVFANMPPEEPSWIWEGRLSQGTCSILSGKPKEGKSTFVRHLIAAVLKGETFLGRKTVPFPVVYVAIEECRNQVRSIFIEAGVDPLEDLILQVGSFDRSRPEQLIIDLKKACEIYRCGLIAIDPLVKSVPVFDTNDYSKATEVTQWFLDLARETNSHVLLVHHSKKGEFAGQESAMGSNGFSGGVDNTITLEANTRFSTLSFRGRYIQHHEVSFYRSKGSLLVVDEDYKNQAIEDQILSAISKAPEGLSIEQLKSTVRIREQMRSRILNNLVAKGMVIAEGGGKKGSPRCFRLSSPLESEMGKELVVP